MKPLNFFPSIVFALLVALAGASAMLVLTPVLGSLAALKLIITLAALSYLLWLLRHSDARIGRVVAVAAWLGLATALWVFAPTLGLFALAHTAMIWLMRSLYCRSSLLTAALDGGLCLLALGAAIWASGTGSLFLSLWCYFLVHAAAGFIPESGSASSREPAVENVDRFDRACRDAESALRRLASHS